MEPEESISAQAESDLITSMLSNLHIAPQNADADSQLMPPPPLPIRRSTRIAEQTSIRNSIQATVNWPAFNPVTRLCHHYQHLGYGCGALAANHLPHYYNSLYPVIFH